ncbi:MAG TPA: type 1 glutamine amidotransferase domain-containing protein [Phycisphaerae bacterium]|nr:type 1 glutamine amidotransferase domain-containing protein [Phycisphaerae bacterium]
MRLQGKRIAILLDQQYQELEVWYPYYRLGEEGAAVTLVAPERGATYESKLGYPCVSDAAAREVGGEDFDAVVVPGGWAPDFMRRDESMIRFIRQCAEADLVLAAICHGGWMLCCTDALRGKRATSFVAIRQDMINAGAEWVDEECVVDGKLITARKPDDLPAFCRAIIRALGG